MSLGGVYAPSGCARSKYPPNGSSARPTSASPCLAMTCSPFVLLVPRPHPAYFILSRQPEGVDRAKGALREVRLLRVARSEQQVARPDIDAAARHGRPAPDRFVQVDLLEDLPAGGLQGDELVADNRR